MPIKFKNFVKSFFKKAEALNFLQKSASENTPSENEREYFQKSSITDIMLPSGKVASLTTPEKNNNELTMEGGEAKGKKENSKNIFEAEDNINCLLCPMDSVKLNQNWWDRVIPTLTKSQSSSLLDLSIFVFVVTCCLYSLIVLIYLGIKTL